MSVLYGTYLWCVADEAHNFTYVLYDSGVVFSAVVPELRCRKFTPQSHCDTYTQQQDDK